MAAARHKHAADPTPRSRLRRLLVPGLAAGLTTATVVGVAVAATPGPASDAEAAADRPAVQHVRLSPSRAAALAGRSQETYSRSARRVTLVARPTVRGHRWMTAPLNVWTGPGEDTHLVTVLPALSRVPVTGRVHGHWAEIVRDSRAFWVNNDYLVRTKPKPPPAPKAATRTTRSVSAPTGGGVLSSAPCATESTVESGLVPAAVALHRAVCAHFPQITEYGGYRPDGEHADGHAVDMMVYGDSATGQAVADWVRANAAALHVDDIIWSQHIWTTQRASEGWRLMPDRGSTTANHYDHVHVRVF